MSPLFHLEAPREQEGKLKVFLLSFNQLAALMKLLSKSLNSLLSISQYLPNFKPNNPNN